MVIREMFESNLTHVVALLSYPIIFLLGAHSDDIIHQDWTFFLKEEHVLADVSAHDEVQNCNVIVTIYSIFLKSCLPVVFPQGGWAAKGWRGKIYSQ